LNKEVIIIAHTFKKIIASGHVIELYEFEKPMFYAFRGSGGRKKEGGNMDRAEEYRKQSCYRAREKIRRLCLANFNNHSKFITLTFADGSVNDVTDIRICNKEFKKLIQRMKYKYDDIKYIAVIEFQDKNNRGAVHYHMISNLPYIPNQELNRLWGNGFVKINDISNVDNVGAYLVKYMLKNVHDERLKGKKAYLASRNLDKPSEFVGNVVDLVIEALDLEKKKKVFASSYPSEYLGKITYSEYNLKR